MWAFEEEGGGSGCRWGCGWPRCWRECACVKRRHFVEMVMSVVDGQEAVLRRWESGKRRRAGGVVGTGCARGGWPCAVLGGLDLEMC